MQDIIQQYPLRLGDQRRYHAIAVKRHAGERLPARAFLLTVAPGHYARFRAAVYFIRPDVEPGLNRGDLLPGQRAAGGDEQVDGGRRQRRVQPLEKRRTADEKVAFIVGKGRELLGIVEQAGMQRQAERHG